MHDPFLKLLRDAWKRKVLPLIRKDRAELARRLARRGAGMMRRPPRAWCLAVRASDQRVNPESAVCAAIRDGPAGRPVSFDRTGIDTRPAGRQTGDDMEFVRYYKM